MECRIREFSSGIWAPSCLKLPFLPLYPPQKRAADQRQCLFQVTSGKVKKPEVSPHFSANRNFSAKPLTHIIRLKPLISFRRNIHNISIPWTRAALLTKANHFQISHTQVQTKILGVVVNSSSKIKISSLKGQKCNSSSLGTKCHPLLKRPQQDKQHELKNLNNLPACCSNGSNKLIPISEF